MSPDKEHVSRPGGPASGSMPFVGIPTFCGFPLHPAAGGAGPETRYDFLVLGIPYDEGTSNRPGARFGPRALRCASMLYTYGEAPALFDVELGRMILTGACVADRGDVPIVPTDGPANRAAISAAVAEIAAGGAFPVGLGGDHSITAPILAGRAQAVPDERPHLLHLDSHTDFDSGLPREAHGSPVRIAVDEDLVSGVTLAGIRGFNNSKQDLDEARSREVAVVTAREWRRGGAEQILETITPGVPVYVSLDIDVFDPSLAPGTGTPEPGGITYEAVKELLRGVADRGTVAGADLVEVSPAYDHGEITAVLGARILLDLMGAAWDTRNHG